MCNIDEIMDMLDWNNPSEIQELGCKLAQDVKCINVFLQPGSSLYVKNVWDNCAKILAHRSDDELRPYLHELFEWLMDMNWPGADCIWNRLKQYEDKKWFSNMLNRCIEEAKALKEDIWLHNLIDIGCEAEG